MYPPDETTYAIAKIKLLNPETSFCLPPGWVKKFGPKYALKLASFYAGFKYPDELNTRDWKKLYELGLVEKFYLNEDEIKKIICSKNPQNISDIKDVNLKICFWCKCTTYILSKHHYPIRKKDNGQETIDICCNCHMEFHHLVDHAFYRLKKEDEENFRNCLISMKENMEMEEKF